MMIKGVGLDLCEVARFSAMLGRRPGIVDTLFTEAESTDREGKRLASQSLAANFAAKEALAKALGAPGGLKWTDCEVLRADNGRPSVRIHSTVASRAQQLGIETIHISISHDAGIAAAVVICEGES